jgi:predicted nucleotidyltransferase component of viral defense system
VISRAIITRQADADGVPASTVERDYILTHALSEIASTPGSERMIFKGGTALRLCYFDDYRYSADLDFSLADGMTPSDARELVAGALTTAKDRIALPQLGLTDHDPPRIAYQGPLGKERQIKLDLADDELVDTPTTQPVFERYPDQQRAAVTAYTLEEVTAEKLRCVIQRVQCRDLFDLHELLVNNDIRAEEIWELFRRKARHKGIDPELFSARFEDRLGRYRRLWERELDEHVPDDPPPFAATERAVRRALRSQLQ